MTKTSALGWRLRSAAVAIPLVLGPAIAGGPLLLALVAVCAAVAAMEATTMFRARGLRPPALLAGALAVLLVASAAWPEALPPRGVLFGGGVGWVVVLAWRRVRGTTWRRAALEATLVAAAALYVGGLLRFAVPLRDLPGGLAWGLLALLSTWGADTAGYVAGRRWGRHRLAPAISPGKTAEGALAGLALAVAAAAVLAPWLGIGPWPTVALGLLVGLAAIGGDLFESALKRLAGVKDAGHLMPGHGGLLDRIDSLLFVVAATYGYAVLVVGR